MLDKIAGNTLEIEVEIQPRGAKQFGLKVCRSPGGQEQTLVYYDVAEQALKVDVRKASLGEGLRRAQHPDPIFSAPLCLCGNLFLFAAQRLAARQPPGLRRRGGRELRW